MMRRWTAGLILGLCLVATAASAQTVATSLSTASGAPGLGKVVRGGSSTTFAYAPGATTPTKTGPAVVITAGLTGPPTVSISCGVTGSASGACNSNRLEVTIQSTSASAPNITQFSVGTLTCPGCTPVYQGGAPAAGASLHFFITGVKKGNTVSFPLGMVVTVPSTGTTGLKTFGFSVTGSSVT
jgi:hypothetical protein